MCWKSPIPTQGEALRIKRYGHGRYARIYRCSECAAWHITSMSRNTYRRVRGLR